MVVGSVYRDHLSGHRMDSRSAQPERTPDFPPLAEVRRQTRIRWYRSPIDPERLRALSARTDRAGWKQAGGHVLLFAALGGSTVLLWAQSLWWPFVLSLWCTGFVASFFKGTAPHELGHGTVFRSRRLNRVFLHLVSLISWWDPYDYASSHTYHHRYTTHPHADRENLLPVEPSLHPWLLLQVFTLNLFSKPGRNFGKGGFLWTVYLTARSALGLPHGHMNIPSQEWLKALHEDQPAAFRQSIIWSRVLLGFHGSVLLVAAVTGLWVLPLVISLSAFIANVGSYLLGTTQHCGLRENVADFRKNTRSITLNPVLRFLYWHMNRHTEHHMYAGVPCYNLEALAAELADDMPKPRTLLGAWIEMRRTWHRQQSEPAHHFDTDVPSPRKCMTVAVDEAMAASIGDLAPSGLSTGQ